LDLNVNNVTKEVPPAEESFHVHEAADPMTLETTVGFKQCKITDVTHEMCTMTYYITKNMFNW